MRVRLPFILSCFAAVTLLAQGPGPNPGRTTVAFKIPDETGPPGGIVQMKLLVTEPTPITSGGPRLDFSTGMFDAIFGIELFDPAGDLNGVAMVNGQQVQVNYTSSSGVLGADYPIMSVALHIRPDAVVGTKTQFNLDPSSIWISGSIGEVTLKPSPPATVTVGGSISITNVVPGGGVVPAGTIVSIQGLGFQKRTQVQLNNIKSSSINLISANEIQFTVAETTNMTGQKIQLVNQDGSQQTYFSYLRGTPWGQSNQPLLGSAIPIFSSVTHSRAIFTAMIPAANGKFSGLAIQNPNLSDTSVTVSLYSVSNDLLGSTSFILPSGCRMMREISELAQGATPGAGSYAVVSAGQAVQTFGFTADSASGTFSPFAGVVGQP
jgi:hypothetical protein